MFALIAFQQEGALLPPLKAKVSLSLSPENPKDKMFVCALAATQNTYSATALNEKHVYDWLKPYSGGVLKKGVCLFGASETQKAKVCAPQIFCIALKER
jgi:hypothetical protein